MSAADSHITDIEAALRELRQNPEPGPMGPMRIAVMEELLQVAMLELHPAAHRSRGAVATTAHGCPG